MSSKNQMSGRLTLFLSMAMGLAYLGGGIGLMTSSQSFGFLPTGLFRQLMAVLLIIYGLYRTYRAYKRYQEERE